MPGYGPIMAGVEVRPPVIVVKGADGDEARLRAVATPDGWVRRAGFDLPQSPWDLSTRRWICTGHVAAEPAAEMALTALVRGVGLVIGLDGPGGFRLRVLDDLHHNGAVVEVEPPSAPRPMLGVEDVTLLRALADGATVDEAARRASLSARTAHRRLAAVRAAYGAANTTEAVARWLEDPGPAPG